MGHVATAESTERLCLSFLFNPHSDLIRPGPLNINTGPERPTVSLRGAEPHACPSLRSLRLAEGAFGASGHQGSPGSSALFTSGISHVLVSDSTCAGAEDGTGLAQEAAPRGSSGGRGQKERLPAPSHAAHGAPVTRASAIPTPRSRDGQHGTCGRSAPRVSKARGNDRTRLMRARPEGQPSPAQPEREAHGPAPRRLRLRPRHPPWGGRTALMPVNPAALRGTSRVCPGGRAASPAPGLTLQVSEPGGVRSQPHLELSACIPSRRTRGPPGTGTGGSLPVQPALGGRQFRR